MESLNPRPRSVWMVSSFPPPFHGVSIFNSSLADYLETHGIACRRISIGTRGSVQSVETGGTAKMLADLLTLARLFVDGLHGKSRTTTIYFTPSQFGSAVIRDWLLSSIARRYFGRVVAHIHGCRWLETWKQGGRDAWFMERALRNCSLVICLGPTYAAEMAKHTGLKTVGIQNGLKPLCDTAPPARTSREKISLLFLSNLMAAKGIWEAAAAARLLCEQGQSAELLCAGDWVREAEREKFEADFSAEIATGSIRFSGFLHGEEKASAFRSADYFLLPTQNAFEGQPLSLIEAMSCGTLPITVRTGGIPDLFEFPGGELLCATDHGTATGMTSTLMRLQTDPELRKKLSQACMDHQRKRLTDETCFANVKEALIQPL